MSGKNISYLGLCIAFLLIGSCTSSTTGNEDQGNVLDLSSADRTVTGDSKSADLSSADLHVTDLPKIVDGALPDLTNAPDLKTPADMTVAVDATIPPDFAQTPDLTQSPADMTELSDLTQAPVDMTSSSQVDGMPVMCGTETADCNMNPNDGCETPLNTAENCGACGNKCQSSGTTNMCVKTNNIYSCANTCDSAHADCNNSSADGCEVTLATDPGEVDNTCGLASEFKINDVDEGQMTSVNDHRILPLGDTDTYRVKFKESTKSCIPGTTQKFAAIVTLEPPASTALTIRTSDGFTCNNFWPNETPTTRCVEWTGHCGADDSRNVYFQIGGFNNQAASCLPYKVTFRACNRGSTCGDCK